MRQKRMQAMRVSKALFSTESLEKFENFADFKKMLQLTISAVCELL